MFSNIADFSRVNKAKNHFYLTENKPHKVKLKIKMFMKIRFSRKFSEFIFFSFKKSASINRSVYKKLKRTKSVANTIKVKMKL